MAYVYQHVRLDKNEVFYIGIGSDSAGEYKRAYSKDRTLYWKRITDKSNYKVEIISEEWLTWEEACEKEKFWITFYGRADLGKGTLVNMTDGGDGTMGIIPTEETIKKRSLALKGRKFSEEHKKKLSNSQIGKIYSEESKIKMSECKKGEKNINYGKPAYNRKKVINLDSNEIYESIKHASIVNNMPKSTLRLLIKKGVKFQYY